MISKKISKSGLKILISQVKVVIPPNPPNVNILVQKDEVCDITPEKVGITESECG